MTTLIEITPIPVTPKPPAASSLWNYRYDQIWENLNRLNTGKMEASAGATLASPAFTGAPTAPTPAPEDDSGKIATTAFVAGAIPDITGLAPLASPAFTGNPTAPTPATSDNDTSIATTAFVQAIVAAMMASSDTSKVCYFDASAAPAGYIKANGGTIGSAASGATTRANADTYALFVHYWAQYDDGMRQIQTSAGVTSARGASAAADWAAGKRMAVLDMRGEWARGWDDGRGVDTGRALGSWANGEVKAHTHGNVPFYNGADTDRGTGNASFFSLDNVGTTASTGGAENTVRGIALLACIKL